MFAYANANYPPRNTTRPYSLRHLLPSNAKPLSRGGAPRRRVDEASGRHESLKVAYTKPSSLVHVRVESVGLPHVFDWLHLKKKQAPQIIGKNAAGGKTLVLFGKCLPGRVSAGAYPSTLF